MKHIIDSIGQTPLVELKYSPNPQVRICAKLEGNNPGGSVKDRAALNMIAKAMERGDIQQDTKLIEATSGNTGIALAMIAAIYGLEIEVVMPDSATAERVQTMRAYGAKVTLLESIEVCRDYAEARGQQAGWYILNQFANADNADAHFKGTGPEIWRDTQQQITHFVSAMGTTGTIMGTSRFLKSQNPEIQIVGCQPSEDSCIPGIRRWPEEYLPKIYDPSRVDRIMDVSSSQAREAARALARKEGIFAGMSAGGAYYAACALAEELSSGLIVFIVCDRGDRYLSSDLFA